MSDPVFICGASRGIGLELARLYLQEGSPVFGIGRSPAPEAPIGGLVYQSVPAERFAVSAFPTLSGQSFGTVILNSAVFGAPPQMSFDLPVENLRTLFETNATAHYSVLKELLPLIRSDGAKVFFVISKAGIQSTIAGRIAIGYRASKAAQLSLGLALVHPLSERGIATYFVNPGSVATRIGGQKARFSPSEGAMHVKNVIAQAHEHPSGTVFDFNGRVIKL